VALAVGPLLSAEPAVKKAAWTVPVIAAPPGAAGARSLEYTVPFGPPLPLAAVAFSPDGKLLAGGGYQEVLVWDLANAKLLRRLGTGQLGEAVHAVAFHKDGKLLAVAAGTPGGPAAVKLFDIETGQVAASFQEPKDAIFSLAFSPDGNLLAGGGVDATLYVWNVAEKKNAAALKGHGDWIFGLAFSGDGKLLASGGADKAALVWEVGSWKRLATVQDSETVQGVALSPDGNLLALAVAGAEDRSLHLRRRDNGDMARQVDLGGATPLDVLWPAKGNRVYVPCSDKTVKVFDAGNWNLVANLAGHADWVYRAAVTNNGTKLASASADGTLRLWLPAENRPLATLLQLAPRSDEWLIATPPGYFAASPAAAIQWKAAAIATPPDKLSGIFRNLDLVKQGLAGGKLAAPPVP
jgi:WD40 repeat protein